MTVDPAAIMDSRIFRDGVISYDRRRRAAMNPTTFVASGIPYNNVVAYYWRGIILGRDPTAVAIIASRISCDDIVGYCRGGIIAVNPPPGAAN